MTNTLTPLRPPMSAIVGFSHPSGRARAIPSNNTTAHRVASSSHCSNRSRRRFFFIARSRNSIAAHVTVLNRRRFRMWMMIGIDTAASPAATKPQVTNPTARMDEADAYISSFQRRRPRGEEAAQRRVQRFAAVHADEVDQHPAAELLQ